MAQRADFTGCLGKDDVPVTEQRILSPNFRSNPHQNLGRFMSSNFRVASGRAMLAAKVVGNGDSVVFLHARVADSRMWHDQLDGVGAHNKAIAYDRRGFGETRADEDDFSAVADLMAVIDAMAHGKPVILVGYSQGGGIVLDAALRHPSRVRALVLIAPNVTGAPDAIGSPEIEGLRMQLKQAEKIGDIDRAIAIRTRLSLDGPLEPEGRVTGQARQLFLDMNSVALRSAPIGANLDAAPAYDRLAEILVPSLVICGDLDLPGIQERSRYVATTVLNGSYHELSGAAHLPSLERPAEITGLVSEFIDRCSRH
jgi:pimeloyl-ACP methyl ester carboxylesterase